MRAIMVSPRARESPDQKGNKKTMNAYSYSDLRARALSAEATSEDRLALLDWMETYDKNAWNGESFNIDDGLRLFPVYDETVDEDGDLVNPWPTDAEVRG